VGDAVILQKSVIIKRGFKHKYKSMALKDIEQDLQKRESELAQRKHEKTVYDVWKSKDEQNPKTEKKWNKVKDEMSGTRVKAISIGVSIAFMIIVIIIMSAIYVRYQKGFFSQERVSFEMTAPQTIDSNVVTDIDFFYKNNNRAKLENAQIKVNFDDYFVPEKNQKNFEQVSTNRGVINIGKINNNEKKKVTLKGHFVGAKKAVADVAGTLRYTPERTNTQYELQARAATEIISSPISVDMHGPQEVVSGNLLDMNIVINNTSKDALSQLKVVLKSPQSFIMQTANPNITSKNTWLIDNIAPHSEHVINVRGILTAPAETVQIFQAEIGSQETDSEYVEYAQGKYAPRMQGLPVIMQQEIDNNNDNVVYAGDRLQYNITFTNNSNISLRDAVASLQFDTEVLDFSQLQLYDGGNYDAQNKKIIWKASDVSGLKVFKPKDTIKVRFNIPVLEKLPVNSKDDYHFSVTTVAVIDSPDIPSELKENKIILSNALSVPVGAKVIFDGEAKYKEGAKPLKVGDKTIYSITLTIDNINNDLGDVVVKAPLPTHVNFENGDGVLFNERTNEVEWTIGDIEHGAGVTSDKVQTVFDVSIVPSIDQIEEQPTIIKKQVLTAVDKFIDKQIRQTHAEINTQTSNQSYRDSVVSP
jgi:hypothetical protein